MILLKKLKTIAFTFAAFGFLFSATLSSCGNKNAEEETIEQQEVEEAEHPEGEEHPTDSTSGG